MHLPLTVHLNGALFGKPDAGTDMTFNFPQLIAHVAKTRELEAGSIIGSGTVSNKQGGLLGSSIANGGVGYCCLAEVRMYETIETGKPQTPFLQVRRHASGSRCSDATAPVDLRRHRPARREVSGLNPA